MKADYVCCLSSSSLSMIINACMGSPWEWKSSFKGKPFIQTIHCKMLAHNETGTFKTHKRTDQHEEMSKDCPQPRVRARSLQLAWKGLLEHHSGLMDQPHHNIWMGGLNSRSHLRPTTKLSCSLGEAAYLHWASVSEALEWRWSLTGWVRVLEKYSMLCGFSPPLFSSKGKAVSIGKLCTANL